MELIDRYVHEVGRHLPRKNREDIKAELKSTLADTLDDRVEGEPTKEDVEQLLKEFGSPQQVAASYWPQGQYLIGPSLFPLFRMVVGIALLVFVIVQLVLFGIAVVFNQEVLTFLDVLEIFTGLISSSFTAFGIIVIVFAILQYFEVKPESEGVEWDPSQLPQVKDEEMVSRGGMVAEITFSLVIVAILLFLPDKIGFVFNPWSEIILNPVIRTYIPLLIVSILLGVFVDVLLLWRGRWELGTRLAKIGTNLFSIYVLFVLLTGHNAWLAEQGAGGFFSFLETLDDITISNQESLLVLGMHAFRLAFSIALIVESIETVGLVYKLIKSVFVRPATINLPGGNA
jgi:hypothetical protein